MAATVEGGNGSTPSEDAVAAIDDLLSVTENMSFFGATTKTYRHPTDPASASFCTVPVKYEFRDRDMRIRAENILRSKCKAQCSTPYPVILRECIKKTIDAAKAVHPYSFVRVNVDAANLSLKLAWRAKDEQNWTNHPDPIILPEEVLDIKARKAPDNLVLGNLPSFNHKMITSPSGSGEAPPSALSAVRPTTRSATRSPKGKNTPKK